MGFLFETICKKGFIDWSQSVPDVGDSTVRVLSTVRIFCLMYVCPDFVCLDSVSCLDSVLIFEKSCTLPACPVGKGRDRGVRTFGDLVCRRMVGSETNWYVPVLELGRTRAGNLKMHAKMV